ncbi:hypothetical protein [Rothia nasimurium]|uniref:hypothetical protein n=1 Tax=Rothia nasimurium TaxID=85336 RepID=UPI002DD67B4C|nr:hypothetical protein [Rothia nasimurium]
MQSLASTGLSRRTLAKGTAWAAPAVLATTVIPAYAASQDLCTKVNMVNHHIKIYENPVGSNGTLRAWFYFGTIDITIPEGRSVVSATVGFWMAKHSGTNDGNNVGLLSPSHPNMKYYASNASKTARGSLTNIGPNPGDGTFWNFRDNIAVDSGAPVGPALPFRYLGESAQTWSDGTRSTGWGIQSTWTPGDVRVATTTPISNGCKIFKIDSLGGIQWIAQNTYLPLNRQLPHWRFWKITLDDGTVIEGQDSRAWVGDPTWRG